MSSWHTSNEDIITKFSVNQMWQGYQWPFFKKFLSNYPHCIKLVLSKMLLKTYLDWHTQLIYWYIGPKAHHMSVKSPHILFITNHFNTVYLDEICIYFDFAFAFNKIQTIIFHLRPFPFKYSIIKCIKYQIYIKFLQCLSDSVCLSVTFFYQNNKSLYLRQK